MIRQSSSAGPHNYLHNYNKKYVTFLRKEKDPPFYGAPSIATIVSLRH